MRNRQPGRWLWCLTIAVLAATGAPAEKVEPNRATLVESDYSRSGGDPAPAGDGWPGHTPPELWTVGRLFHTPFDGRYEDRLRLGRAGMRVARDPLVSPNGAYWAEITPAGRCEPSGPRIDCIIDSADVRVSVFNERRSLLTLEVADRAPNLALSTGWVGEKLLFVRVWWGRVLGTDSLIDVERQVFVYREMVHDGGPVFRQRRAGPAGARED